jgi:uncharacterized membrane protein
MRGVWFIGTPSLTDRRFETRASRCRKPYGFQANLGLASRVRNLGHFMGDAAAHPNRMHHRIAEIRKRLPLKNTFKETRDRMSLLDKVWITNNVGTMGFFLLIFIWTAIWLGWNFLAPERLRFDPPMGFVFWLFISNMIQILLMPLIMVGQNIQGKQSEARAEHDLEVNIKAEQEIEVILDHLAHQNDMLLAMLTKQGIKLEEVLSQTR